ncbi:MAG: 1-acyl-sn-glycerol-3-phosphate acyltransferase [Clostridia bacterium]
MFQEVITEHAAARQGNRGYKKGSFMRIVLVTDRWMKRKSWKMTQIEALREELERQGHQTLLLSNWKKQKNGTALRGRSVRSFQLYRRFGVIAAKPRDRVLQKAFEGADLIHFCSPFFLGRRGGNRPADEDSHFRVLLLNQTELPNVWDRWLQYWNDHFYSHFYRILCFDSSTSERLHTAGYQSVLSVAESVASWESFFEESIQDVQSHGYRPIHLTKLQQLFCPDLSKQKGHYFHRSGLRHLLSRLLTNCLAVLLFIINHIFFGFRVEGRRNLRKVSGGAVSIMNHMHPMDCTMVKVALMPRTLWYVSLSRNFTLPLVGWLIKALGAVSLPETAPELIAFQKQAVTVVEKGDIIHYYPEGMLSPYNVDVRPFYRGRLPLRRLQSPHYPHDADPQKTGLLRRLVTSKPNLVLRIGAPIYRTRGQHPPEDRSIDGGGIFGCDGHHG